MTLSKYELRKVSVLDRVECGALSASDGADALGISDRHMRRLRARYRQEGEYGIIHRSRGRSVHHAISDEIKEAVIALFHDKYSDCNFTHFAEKLREVEGVSLSDSSVGRILRAAGVRSKDHKRRRPRCHARRERRSRAGELWQTDATPFAWLGDKFGRFALHTVIDDATGIVVGACFTQNECYDGYVECVRQGIERYELPMALYSDCHTIFRSPNEKLTIEQELDGVRKPLSNFGHALAELGIAHIKATTPQAKGRIERLWKTLQDRIPAELRLMGVTSIEEANAVLPQLIADHNARSAVAAASCESAYRQLDYGTDLDIVLARRETRIVDAGCSVKYKGAVLTAENPELALIPRTTVEVRETRGGDVFVLHGDDVIKLRRIEGLKRLTTEDGCKSTNDVGRRLTIRGDALHLADRSRNRSERCKI